MAFDTSDGDLLGVLKSHHNKSKRRSRAIVVALITALGSAAGGGVKWLSDSEDLVVLQSVIAERAAVNDRRWESATADAGLLVEQVIVLRESVASLKATVRMMAADSRHPLAVAKAADEIKMPAINMDPARHTQSKISGQVVDQYRSRLFK